jgi:hypothetical protein
MMTMQFWKISQDEYRYESQQSLSVTSFRQDQLLHCLVQWTRLVTLFVRTFAMQGYLSHLNYQPTLN